MFPIILFKVLSMFLYSLREYKIYDYFNLNLLLKKQYMLSYCYSALHTLLYKLIFNDVFAETSVSEYFTIEF